MKVPARIVFMGTPDFAVPSLQALLDSSSRGWQVVAVATQPDRPAGRGQRLVSSPVKQLALQQALPVLQPATLRKDPALLETLRQLAPTVLVVAAYGLILPASVLALPTFGAINVHASLLPAYRGASPIAAALLDGQSETGVTIMLMDEGLDTGPALRQASLPIQPSDTTAALSARLADLGAALLVETLADWLAGDVAPIPQQQLSGTPSTCQQIDKEDGQIDWTLSAEQIERRVRAYTPWPTAFTWWKGSPFKILQAAVVPGQAVPGSVVRSAGGPAVGTGAGLLLLQRVQPAGKRPLAASSFLNGAPEFIGTLLPQR
ncbi:MAG: methionyl-tRNA formyltransferase [Chloroflexi bacterium]|nr:methionyl-tRNA formyltransferase [Chloroflexota bacterium]